MAVSVHLLSLPGPAPLARLRELLDPAVTLTVGPDLPDPPRYDVLVAGRPEREQVAANPNMEMLIIPWSGLPTSTRALMVDFPHVAVHNVHHNAAPVAEMAAALLLAAAKFVVPMDRALRAHDWTPRYAPNPALLLEGKTALVLGYGAIGQRVARICRGLGMEILATRRHPDRTSANAPDAVYPPEALDELLPRAHALVVCLPLTGETEGLIGEAELARLPKGAVLVNVARGPIVKEGPLYAALQSGRLRAAGLDVWYNYPPDEAARARTPPANYPFHELENVVMSPHRGGALGAGEPEAMRMEALAEVINAYVRGGPIPNRVDVDRGY